MNISTTCKHLAMAFVVVATGVMAMAQQSPIAVKWEMIDNKAGDGFYSCRFVVKNVSTAPLQRDWTFYFNQFSRKVETSKTCPVDIKEISTTYYRVVPNSHYKTLAPGDTMVVDMLMRGNMVNICYVPQGGHVVLGNASQPPLPVKIEIAELSHPGQWAMRDDYPDGGKVFDFNTTLAGATTVSHCYNIFPSPKQVTLTAGTTQLGNLVSVKGKMLDFKLKGARKLLVEGLKERGIYVSSGQRVVISLGTNKKLNDNAEYYELTVGTGDTITIVGTTQEGVMNGVKTLLAAIDHSKGNRLDNAVIKDYPGFHYRGLMLDIARNFTTKNNIKRFIDILAYYKLNRYQFHFTDDEAWRIEIQGLPELTEVASRRGYTTGENEFLAQIFDGTGNPNDRSQSANGYLTRNDFVEILKYADARGVKIIPEIETPGHARAAIVAMKARYNKYKDSNMALATQYKLWDDADTGHFVSAQSYHDNVLNVAQEGVYNFLTKVIEELRLMYRDAGLKLDVVHLGGDEVPREAWDGSPAVQSLMKANGLKNAHEVSEYYLRRISDLLYAKHILIQGWQEVGLRHSDEFNAVMAPRFAGVNAWSTVGGDIKIPYTLANAGYPTILSNVTNFYMDMGYSWHQYERGLHWGGAVDEFASWSSQPLNIYKTARVNYYGKPIDLARVANGKPVLTKPQNVIGIIGPLWAETIRNFAQVQNMVLPKALGLVERAWNPAVEWNDDVTGSFEAARAGYNAKIGLVELPILAKKGLNFHLGQPGIKVVDGKLVVNTRYGREVVRYTLDGSEPTENSPVWTTPVPVGNAMVIKAKAYYLSGQSVTTYLWLKPHMGVAP